jgi:hypothetical protein
MPSSKRLRADFPGDLAELELGGQAGRKEEAIRPVRNQFRPRFQPDIAKMLPR